MRVSSSRISPLNRRSPNPQGDFVLYWMVASRRPGWNFGLQHAIHQAIHFKKPLVILEDLRLGHRWASPRFHQFVIQGMADQARAFAKHPVMYHPFVEQKPQEGKGMLAWLCARAVSVVTDYFPCFFLPEMVRRLGKNSPVLVESVDSNGLMPLTATPKDFPTAYLFRRFLQKNLRPHLSELPLAEPLVGVQLPRYSLPAEFLSRWPSALNGVNLSGMPLDQEVAPLDLSGGCSSAEKTLGSFLRRLDQYGEQRNDPDADAASGLSPFLHFGHISTHQIFSEVVATENWNPERLSTICNGSREGWWNVSPSVEGFLDELVTWREVGHVFCHHRPDYDQFDSLPDWAKQTLKDHAGDTRPNLYSLYQLENSQTHDPLWNAAQRQLREEGRIHNYLRMLWGKKILEWSDTPENALSHLIHLNNRWAIDGRDPNSYSGIFWTLGRFDRAWGPERPIYGTVRYMSSDNTARKVSLKGYLKKFSEKRGSRQISLLPLG